MDWLRLSFSYRKKLAIRHVPDRFTYCLIDASSAYHNAIELHDRDFVIHAFLGCYDRWNSGDHHAPWPLVRWQSKTRCLVNDLHGMLLYLLLEKSFCKRNVFSEIELRIKCCWEANWREANRRIKICISNIKFLLAPFVHQSLDVCNLVEIQTKKKYDIYRSWFYFLFDIEMKSLDANLNLCKRFSFRIWKENVESYSFISCTCYIVKIM